MKTINLDFNITDLDGKEIENGGHAGKMVAGLLVSQAKGDALKFWAWALELNNKKELTLDPSDHATLKAFIETSESLFVISKAQILAKL